jgi:hypothetical protein
VRANTGFSPNSRLPTGGRDSREPASVRRTCLRSCRQQRRTSRTALEVLFDASASLRRNNKRQLKTEGRSRYKKYKDRLVRGSPCTTAGYYHRQDGNNVRPSSPSSDIIDGRRAVSNNQYSDFTCDERDSCQKSRQAVRKSNMNETNIATKIFCTHLIKGEQLLSSSIREYLFRHGSDSPCLQS